MMMRLLLNSLRCLRYARSGGVSRVAKGADCKATSFCCLFNGLSDKMFTFDSFPISRLGAASERFGLVRLALRVARFSAPRNKPQIPMAMRATPRQDDGCDDTVACRSRPCASCCCANAKSVRGKSGAAADGQTTGFLLLARLAIFGRPPFSSSGCSATCGIPPRVLSYPYC
jgi:hypothetical protein